LGEPLYALIFECLRENKRERLEGELEDLLLPWRTLIEDIHKSKRESIQQQGRLPRGILLLYSSLN